MFESFFPKPKLFFSSAGIWAFISILFWVYFGESTGKFLGFNLDSNAETVIGLGYFFTPEFMWFDIYFIFCSLVFSIFWFYYLPHIWQLWSVMGSCFLIFSTYVTVQVNVIINEWYGPFYNDIQTALSGNGDVTATTLYLHLLTFSIIAFSYIGLAVLKSFFISHYIFRWRNAMNDFYIDKWSKVRGVEGSSQRIQEDTMQFASIMESVGVYIIRSAMTLIAFLPVLSALSVHVETIPIIGMIPYPLVTLALLWSIFGTVLLLVAGIKLPGLKFKNQRVEAAFRKELVYGEDSSDRAKPPELKELFDNVRRNYFRIYWHFAYFNVFRFMYGQADSVFAYVILIPTIAAGKITLGTMNQILRAFGQVANSFQFLVNSWTTIIELMSIYKRLQAFEALIYDKKLPKIDQEFLKSQKEE